MSQDATGRPSTPSLFADALTQITALFEREIHLLRTEVGEKVSQAVTAVATLVGAAVLLLAALVLLLEGVVELLVAYGWQPYAASFLVGVILAAVAVAAVFLAMRGLSARNLMPNRTINQFGKDAKVVREQVK